MKILQATEARPEGVKIGKLAGITWIRWRAPQESDQEFMDGALSMTRSFLRSQVKLAKGRKEVTA